MIDILFRGIGSIDIALTVIRVAVGVFFMFSGYHKLFNAQRHRALVDELTALHVGAIRINQWWVPLVEFAGGAVPFLIVESEHAALKQHVGVGFADLREHLPSFAGAVLMLTVLSVCASTVRAKPSAVTMSTERSWSQVSP